jgi:hypothetical protein
LYSSHLLKLYGFDSQKEVFYFTAELTLPRVGEVTLRYVVDRYTCRIFNGAIDHTGREGWSAWRILLNSNYVVTSGIGTKTLVAARETIEPLIHSWLEGSEYVSSRKKAIAHFIIEKVRDTRYGLVNGQDTLVKYRNEITEEDFKRIDRAIELLREAYELLRQEEA